MRDGLVVVTGAGGFIGHALVAHFQRSGRLFRALVRQRDAVTVLPAGHHAVARPRDGCGRRARSAVGRRDGRRASRGACPRAARDRGRPGRRISRGERRRHPATRTRGDPRGCCATGVREHGQGQRRAHAARPAIGARRRPGPARRVCKEQARRRARARRDVRRNVARAPDPETAAGVRRRRRWKSSRRCSTRSRADAPCRWVRLTTAAACSASAISIDAIDAALDAPEPPRGVHFVADRESVSVPDLVRAIAAALGVPARLRTIPVPLLKLAAIAAGRGAMVERLVNSLEVDASSFCAATGWRPRHSLAEGLEATARWWRIRHAI